MMMKLIKLTAPFVVCFLLISWGQNALATNYTISTPPDDFDPFYKKYIDVDGIAILGSEKVSDQAMQFAADIVEHMLSDIPDVAARLSAQKTRVSIIAIDEAFTTLPEMRRWKGKSSMGRLYDTRCGGGGVKGNPVTVVCERNLINVRDPFRGRYSVLIHEFGHTIQNLGLDDDIKERIEEAYQHAREKGLFMKKDGVRPSYMMNNVMEFFAETGTVWFNGYNPRNPASSPFVKSRDDLKVYDPEIYAILASLYSEDHWAYPRIVKKVLNR